MNTAVKILVCLMTMAWSTGRASTDLDHSPANPLPATTNLLARLQGVLALDYRTEEGLRELAAASGALSVQARQRSQHLKAEHRLLVATNGLDQVPLTELKRHYEERPDALRVRDVRGLTELSRLAYAALSAPTADARNACVTDIAEIMSALRNNYLSPVPEAIGLTTPWKILVTEWNREVGRGTTVATNLSTPGGQSNDVSMADPQPSSFWACPASIARQDLYAGFDRRELPCFTNMIHRYHKPKTSLGTQPGFEAIGGDGREYKLKFGEINSEPFTARIFHVLGYHVDPTDYSAEIRIQYDRRMIREFNLRGALTMRIRPLGIPAGTIQLQPHYDPFHFISRAVFKDGRQMDGAAFKKALLHNPVSAQATEEPANFRTEIETAVDYLVMTAANVQPEETTAESIGQWSFSGLGHEHRRELRGAALLAAWLGWFDTRQDNTRLRVTRQNGRSELQHFFTDLGGGMGEATGTFHRDGEDPDEFTWTFTKPEVLREKGQVASAFRVTQYETIVPTAAFHDMTVDDARWMARLIAQLTEAQLRAALVASGYDQAEARLYLEKLINRRDQMIRDLRLDKEIPLLRPTVVKRDFTYDPAVEPAFTATDGAGHEITARSSTQMIRRGKLAHSLQASQ